MTLCKSCTYLLRNSNWRKYILTNYSCRFCDVPYNMKELIDFVDKLEIGEKATICGVPFIKVNNNTLVNLSRR